MPASPATLQRTLDNGAKQTKEPSCHELFQILQNRAGRSDVHPRRDPGSRAGFRLEARLRRRPELGQNQNIETTDLFTGATHTTALEFKTGYRLDFDAGYQFCR